MNDCLILVPMKKIGSAKSRLNSGLPKKLREQVASKLLLQTLAIIRKVIQELDNKPKVAVVTDCEIVVSMVADQNVLIITPPLNGTLSTSLSFSAQWAEKNGFSGICILPADLGRPDMLDLKKLLCIRMNKSQMVICPSRDFGTNALYISPPTAFSFCYGEASFEKHIRLAQKRKIPFTILDLESLKFDVDTMQDLRELELLDPDFLMDFEGLHEFS